MFTSFCKLNNSQCHLDTTRKTIGWTVVCSFLYHLRELVNYIWFLTQYAINLVNKGASPREWCVQCHLEVLLMHLKWIARFQIVWWFSERWESNTKILLHFLALLWFVFISFTEFGLSLGTEINHWEHLFVFYSDHVFGISTMFTDCTKAQAESWVISADIIDQVQDSCLLLGREINYWEHLFVFYSGDWTSIRIYEFTCSHLYAVVFVGLLSFIGNINHV